MAQKPIPTLKRKAKIVAERLSGLDSVKTVAENNRITERSVYRYVAEAETNPKLNKLVTQELLKMGERLDTLKHKTLDRIDEALDRDNTPLNQLATTFGVLYDKHRLETGQSTSNVAVQHDYTARCLAYLEAISKHDPGASVERKREYLLNSSALADVPVEVKEKVVIPE
jgi:hypothetical protein